MHHLQKGLLMKTVKNLECHLQRLRTKRAQVLSPEAPPDYTANELEETPPNTTL